MVIDANGKLGIVMSSARYKRDIRDMDAKSAGLLKLHPVTFRYRSDPAGVLQYGLVAEEVAKIYPELVTYGSDGNVMAVRYLMLSAMLLNELQKQTGMNERQGAQLRRQSDCLERQAGQDPAALAAKLAAVEAAARHDLAAQRAAFERRLSAPEQAMPARDRAQAATAFGG